MRLKRHSSFYLNLQRRSSAADLCDKTNGTIQFTLTDVLGHKVTVGPLAGPQ